MALPVDETTPVFPLVVTPPEGYTHAAQGRALLEADRAAYVWSRRVLATFSGPLPEWPDGVRVPVAMTPFSPRIPRRLGVVGVFSGAYVIWVRDVPFSGSAGTAEQYVTINAAYASGGIVTVLAARTAGSSEAFFSVVEDIATVA